MLVNGMPLLAFLGRPPWPPALHVTISCRSI